MSPRLGTAPPDRRAGRPTERVVWTVLSAEDVSVGDVLVWGKVLAKAWGGALGIEAWRVVIEDRHRPLWLAPDEPVHCRQRGPQAPPATLAGVVGSGPSASDRASNLRQLVTRAAAETTRRKRR